MSKFTREFYELGDRVITRIGDGTKAGVVTDWGHIGIRDPEVMHYVKLDGTEDRIGILPSKLAPHA